MCCWIGDGDGGSGLVQMVEQPQQFNAVFHYGDGELSCWQYDIVEMSCRDYPWSDGAMVRQYDTGTKPIGIPTSHGVPLSARWGRRRSAPPWRYTRIRRRMARRYSPIWWTTRRWIRTPLRRSLRNWWEPASVSGGLDSGYGAARLKNERGPSVIDRWAAFCLLDLPVERVQNTVSELEERFPESCP